MRVLNSIADLRALARARVPRAIFEYADRGSFDELTLARNRSDLQAIEFRQRVMRDLSKLSVASTMLGQPVTIPLGIAPTGLSGLFHGNGEIHGARAAQAFGIPYCMSTMSICSIEDVHEAVREPFWFQLYLMRDRGFNQELIARARAAQCSALMLTVDLQVQGIRRRDAHNGLSIPPRLTLSNALDMASKPAWALGVLTAKRRSFGNLTVRLGKGTGLKTLSEWIGSQFDPAVTWKEVDWIRSHWPGKLIIKGILDPEDAQVAAGLGIDAMVVSNHGGRQLDGAPSSISVLPEIAEATAGRCEVWFDGGIQSGQDMLRAIALGASACLIGKAYLYAMGAMGGPGVTLALNILRKELEITLALTGCTDVRTVDASILRRSTGKAQPGASLRQLP
ncbi:MAG: alpha-hydroxy acid oxidase [Steroidobacteraceae bacterium]